MKPGSIDTRQAHPLDGIPRIRQKRLLSPNYMDHLGPLETFAIMINLWVKLLYLLSRFSAPFSAAAGVRHSVEWSLFRFRSRSGAAAQTRGDFRFKNEKIITPFQVTAATATVVCCHMAEYNEEKLLKTRKSDTFNWKSCFACFEGGLSFQANWLTWFD